jgi:hypothetical protein
MRVTGWKCELHVSDKNERQPDGAEDMTIPQLLADLLQLLFDMAVPAATCRMVLAGLALRQESGVNFEVGGSHRITAARIDIPIPTTRPTFVNLPSFSERYGIVRRTMPPQ